MSRSQIDTTVRNNLLGRGDWDTIESIDYRFNKETQASILTIKGTAPVDWSEYSYGPRTLELPGGGFSPPLRRQRLGDDAAELPYWQEGDYSCFVTTVRLPATTKFENWDFNSVFDTELFGRIYYRTMELRKDRTLRMIRGSRVQQEEISASKATRDNEKLDDFDNSMALLEYYPDETMVPAKPARPVPAADEIDWSGADVPCLPPARLKP